MEADFAATVDDAPLTHRFIRPVLGLAAVAGLGSLLLGWSGECTAYDSIQCSWLMQWMFRITVASAVFWVCAGVGTVGLLVLDGLLLGAEKLLDRVGPQGEI